MHHVATSVGHGPDKIGGGKSVVKQWVEKFDAPPLSEIIKGIVDLDLGNVPSTRVNVIGRYSIENYLLDPFVVFGLLVEEGRSPDVLGINKLTLGNEHLVRAMPNEQLQNVVSTIQSMVEAHLPSIEIEEKEKRHVKFTSGQELLYPAWMITRKGRDLFAPYQNLFSSASVVSPLRLRNSLRRIRLIPIELADIMKNLQG